MGRKCSFHSGWQHQKKDTSYNLSNDVMVVSSDLRTFSHCWDPTGENNKDSQNCATVAGMFMQQSSACLMQLLRTNYDPGVNYHPLLVSSSFLDKKKPVWFYGIESRVTSQSDRDFVFIVAGSPKRKKQGALLFVVVGKIEARQPCSGNHPLIVCYVQCQLKHLKKMAALRLASVPFYIMSGERAPN